jgi:hypothetical protein
MDMPSAQLGGSPIARKLSLRGRRTNLCWIRQHGGVRSSRAARCRDCCRRRPTSPFLSGLEWRGFAETANEFLHHWRHPARLAVPSHVPGHSSRRVRDDAFRSSCGRPFGRSAFRSRSVLLGRAVTPAKHCAGYGERPYRHGRHLLVQSSPLERQRCGSRLLPSAKKCARKTAWQRLSGEFML